ncbi:hypothetical protein CLIB1444_09S04368 [[Candida] jaroonii]|uniref:Uncharacterized protein n=1 Tax=[Candida] jaroonii TaxID=467808 RepID=A0ACA9YCQ3_9ASCO|nr:hypothetical protein CLIB1444_09S04368 [[Candida] jaroonii]
MFKFNLLSIFQTNSNKSVIDSKDIPKNFTINNDNNKVLNISMVNGGINEDDDFININFNELTYAEVAKLNQDKPINYNKNKSSKTIINKKSKAVGKETEEELVDSIHEKFKSDIHYKKHKQFKLNEKRKRSQARRKH